MLMNLTWLALVGWLLLLLLWGRCRLWLTTRSAVARAGKLAAAQKEQLSVADEIGLLEEQIAAQRIRATSLKNELSENPSASGYARLVAVTTQLEEFEELHRHAVQRKLCCGSLAAAEIDALQLLRRGLQRELLC